MAGVTGVVIANTRGSGVTTKPAAQPKAGAVISSIPVRTKPIYDENDFYSWVKNLYGKAADVFSLNFLRRRADEWAGGVRELMSLSVPPGLQAEKKALLSRAVEVKANIEKILGKVPSVQTVGLGFLPLVPVAIAAVAVSACVTLIGSWFFDYRKFAAKLQESTRQQSVGVTAVQAAQNVDTIDRGAAASAIEQAKSGTFASNLSKYSIPIIGGLALLAVAYVMGDD